ncbi:uncharacterized protein LOC127715984 isoform X2 [Mytilus californianus]|uniref:uncharacterized protein LOC127715984 isoform X2 n=1 Tax=Mytilus californianus TaxID=6549 RepID=UPI002245D506|nr:uncharacterized protein LOC127715984 isoform X2 [Mytilus californianus]
MSWIIFYLVSCCFARQVTDASKVRLVDGKSLYKNGVEVYEGRLEVFYNNEWGNVCDNGFNQTSARVVCRMLGFEGNAVMNLNYRYGNKPITLDDVTCIGSEKDIMDCKHTTWRTHNCNHEEDVGVRCEQMWRISRFKEDVVLEFFMNNSYVQVCNTNVADEKVCQMLGIESKDFAIDVIPSSQKARRFVDLNCKGTEMLLSQCKRTIHLLGECKARSNAFRCFGQRLTHGNTPYNGRLELHHDGQWGTVCDDGFGDDQASVVCRYLELSWNGRFSYEFKDWSAGSNYLLDDIVCTGRESSIVKCRHTSWNTHNCDTTHREDVGIQCSPDEMALTLEGGNKPNEGIAQIMLGKQRTNICSLGFDKKDAIVFCREFNGNYRHVVVVSRHTCNTSSDDIYQESFNCTGNETKLVLCPRYSVRCPSESKAAIVCDPTHSSVELEVPSPMIVNKPVNITCSATGGSPVPDIWWNCCNDDNATHVVLSENQILSVLEFMPSRECNAETCTCFVHHSETTFPEIQKAENLVVYYPVRGDLNVTVPILIEHHQDILTCEVFDGNPLPDIWWTCSGMPYDNVTSVVTHNSSTSILYLTPTADYHNKTCTCIGRQINTTFEEISKPAVLHVLYSVNEVTVSSTDLLAGLRSYLICRVAGGNPKPDAKWFCDGELQTFFLIRSPDAVIALMSFIPTAAHEGKRCTCVVSQPGTIFNELSQSLVLRVTRVNNETKNRFVNEGLSTLDETTVHQIYSTNEDIKARSVTEGYAVGGYSTVEETTTLQSYTRNDVIKAKYGTEGYAGKITETKIGGYSTAEETTTLQSYTRNYVIKAKYGTEGYAVSSTYRKEPSKQMTTSLSSESNEESFTNGSQYVNTTDNDSLSLLTQANETKGELYLTRTKEDTTAKSYTDKGTDRSMDDSSGLTKVHVSTIVGGSIGLVVLCIVIFIVFKLKKKTELAEKADYSYVNAVYQPPESQNSENEPIFTE